MKKLWPFIFYFWQYAGVAFMLPFVILFYQKAGFTGNQIGILAGISPLITLISAPAWTSAADLTKRHKLILNLTLLAGVLIIFFIPLVRGFYLILFLMISLNIFMAPVSSLADNATITMLGDEKDLYGRLRLGGTIGFAIAAPFAGVLVQKYGIISAFWGAAAMYFLAFITSRRFIYKPQTSNTKPVFSFASGFKSLLVTPKWIFFIIASLAGGFAFSSANNYFLALMKELGSSESAMGIALSIGTLCELPLLFFGNVILKYIKPYPLFILALLISGIRLILFSLVITTNQALAVQFFNGMTFPLFWMAGVAFISENAPEGMNATAQGIFSAAVFGIGTAFGGYLGGSLLGAIGAKGMFQVFGITTTIIVFTIFITQKIFISRTAQR